MFIRKLLDLHLVQAETALKRAQSNRYSTSVLFDFQTKLRKLLDCIKDKTEHFADNETDFPIYKSQLDFIFKSLEYLDNSTLNLIPFELVFCLRQAMNDWIKDKDDNYIIVTSLSNNINSFNFDPWLAQKQGVLDSIQTAHNIKFPCSLVQVTLPKMLVRDYLTSIVLYHELGHFIDEKYKISAKIAFGLYNDILHSDKEAKIYELFFDKLPVPGNFQKEELILKRMERYCAEYFCDLFAAQYLGEGYMTYLNYITSETKYRHQATHPSSQKRKEVYEDFLEGRTNAVVDLFNEQVEGLTGSQLCVRFSKIETNDFYRFLPIEIKNDQELHGIFAYGWSVWLDNWEEFSSSNQLKAPLLPEKVYQVINNLLEKSIGNYIVKNLWNKQVSP